MHRVIEEHLEEVLAGAGLPASHPAQQHLQVCPPCREVVGAMREQSGLLRELGQAQEAEPPAGFYARVWERIEAQRPASIWEVFASSLMGRGLAAASLALMLTMGGFLVSSESAAPQSLDAQAVVANTYPMLPASDFPDEVFAMPSLYAAAGSGRGAVLVDLVSYQGR
jgi:predicted anti-sigma-YlaC factor YlaD